MATTYNNLYMDIRQQLRTAGVQASTLEARELVCFASGKTRQQLQRDGQLYVPPAVEAYSCISAKNCCRDFSAP